MRGSGTGGMCSRLDRPRTSDPRAVKCMPQFWRKTGRRQAKDDISGVQSHYVKSDEEVSWAMGRIREAKKRADELHLAPPPPLQRPGHQEGELEELEDEEEFASLYGSKSHSVHSTPALAASCTHDPALPPAPSMGVPGVGLTPPAAQEYM